MIEGKFKLQKTNEYVFQVNIMTLLLQKLDMRPIRAFLKEVRTSK